MFLFVRNLRNASLILQTNYASHAGNVGWKREVGNQDIWKKYVSIEDRVRTDPSGTFEPELQGLQMRFSSKFYSDSRPADQIMLQISLGSIPLNTCAFDYFLHQRFIFLNSPILLVLE